MRTVDEALALLTEVLGDRVLPSERVPLAEALDRVLAERVEMDHDVPPFRRAAMDGFALAVGEVAPGARFPVEQSVMAGEVPAAPLRAEAAARVMTGAPVPDGARCVVPFEWTREEGVVVVVERVPHPPYNIVERGEHVRQGAVVLEAGCRLTPAALGALAAAGCARPAVRRRPRVAILGTGSELVPVERTPGPGAIRNSNSFALVGQVLRAGGEPHDLGLVDDEVGALRAAVRRGLGHDVLLLSGGVSRGDLDLVPGALEAEGVRCLFHRWAVKPGGPMWVGVRGECLVFGLPGNPAGAFIGFEVLAVPALDALLRGGVRPRRTVLARYDGEHAPSGPWRRFRPVHLDGDGAGGLVARPCAWRGSGDLFGLAAADALAILPEQGASRADHDAWLEVLPLHDAGPTRGPA